MTLKIKKNIKSFISKGMGVLLLGVFVSSCTGDFEEINTNPNLPTDADAKAILGGVQYYVLAEPRFVTWRGNLLYASQFANQFTTNVVGSWWAGGDAYANNQGWTNNVFDQSFKKSGINLRNLLIKYNEINDTNGQAMAKILMSFFYQKMTDIYGSIPYEDVTVAELEVNNPTYNTQHEIYKLIIEDLKVQMNKIGASTAVIDGAEGDFVYSGDPQKWKRFANTLRLRMALRGRDAFIANGEQAFIDGVINDCVNNPLIDMASEASLLRSRTSLIQSHLDGGFEDVYWGFGGRGSKWTFTERFISLLRDNNDPRLTEIAGVSENGGYQGSYVNIRTAPAWDDVSKPTEKIIGTSLTDIENQAPVMVITAAESYFLQAEAALLGYGGDANNLYQEGIRASVNFWGASDAGFVGVEPVTILSGSNDEQLQQVFNQRWLASITNGYEGWSLVRRTDLIPGLTDNTVFWVSAPNNGNVPKRLPYSTTEITSNLVNVTAAIALQGDDVMSTALWWDVN